jgi:hypothetical protein
MGGALLITGIDELIGLPWKTLAAVLHIVYVAAAGYICCGGRRIYIEKM